MIKVVQYRIPTLVVGGEMVKEDKERVYEKIVETHEEEVIGFDLAKLAIKIGKYNKTQVTKILTYPDGIYQMSFRLIEN